MDKHIEALNHACNRFLLSEPKFVTKNWHILIYRFATWPIAQTKIFCCTHTLQNSFLSLEFNFVYIKIVQHGCQLGLWYQFGKYSPLHNLGVHDKVIANQGGRGRFSFTHFVPSATRKV